MSILVTKNN